MDQARTHMEHLFALTDSVALLDMLAGFADLVALSPHVYTRPRLLATSTPSTAAGMPTAGGLQQAGPHPMAASADLVNGPGPDTHAGALVIKTGRHAIISTFKQVCCNMHQCHSFTEPPRHIFSFGTHLYFFSFDPVVLHHLSTHLCPPRCTRRARAHPSCRTTAR